MDDLTIDKSKITTNIVSKINILLSEMQIPVQIESYEDCVPSLWVLLLINLDSLMRIHNRDSPSHQLVFSLPYILKFNYNVE